MLKFREFRESKELSEKVIKSFKVGKHTGEIRQDGSKFVSFIDNEKLDSFSSAKDAEQSIKDFLELVGKR